jgi:hypothetical protein
VKGRIGKLTHKHPPPKEELERGPLGMIGRGEHQNVPFSFNVAPTNVALSATLEGGDFGLKVSINIWISHRGTRSAVSDG